MFFQLRRSNCFALRAGARSLMALQKIVAHVSAVNELLGGALASSQAFESVRKAHCAALATSLASHSWCPEDASVASTKLASSCFSDADKASLCKVVADGLAQSVQQPTKKKQLQHLKDFGPFLKASDVEFLSGPSALRSKIARAADVAYSIGLVCPSEPSTGNILSTLIGLGAEELQEPNAFLASKREFKCELKARLKRGDPPVHLTAFPAVPAELPDVLYQSAYATEKPAGQSTGIAIGKGPLRKTNKLVTPSNANSALQGPLQSLNLLLAALQAQQGQQPTQPNITLLGRQQRPQLALQDHHGSSSAGSASATTVTPPSGSTLNAQTLTASPPLTSPASTSPSPTVSAPPSAGPTDSPGAGGPGAMSPMDPEKQAQQMLHAWELRDNEKRGAEKTSKPMKRPAARMEADDEHGSAQAKAKAKAKAASKANVKPASSLEKARAKYRAMSRREILKLRPNGCGKCRWQPPCCPSCFVQK